MTGQGALRLLLGEEAGAGSWGLEMREERSGHICGRGATIKFQVISEPIMDMRRISCGAACWSVASVPLALIERRERRAQPDEDNVMVAQQGL